MASDGIFFWFIEGLEGSLNHHRQAWQLPGAFWTLWPYGNVHLPSGKLTCCYGKSQFLMGKSTISMAIFHCYVSSPEGTSIGGFNDVLSVRLAVFHDLRLRWSGPVVAENISISQLQHLIILLENDVYVCLSLIQLNLVKSHQSEWEPESESEPQPKSNLI